MILEEVKKQGGVILESPRESDAVYNHIFEIGAVEDTFNWQPWLPLPEDQKRTAFCVTFSRLNCAEIRNKKDNGNELNLSDRYLGVMSKTSLQGNSLNNVSDVFRKQGTVKEDVCTWKDEWLAMPSKYWKEIKDLSGVPADAQRFSGGNHSWVYGRAAMRSALAFSPLQIAVGVGSNWGHAFITDPKDYGSYHAVTLYWIDGDGNYYIYDSVGEATKTLDKNYNIMQCKSFVDLPENWKEINKTAYDSIHQVFGPMWSPADIFARRHLIEKGIYGAVRVRGTYWVFLIGPGGRQIKDQADFISVFGTKYQNGIVGEIDSTQAKLLGINLPGVGSQEAGWHVELGSCFLKSIFN